MILSWASRLIQVLDIFINCLYFDPPVMMYNFSDYVAACKASNAHDFISQFPKEYQTDVGEGSMMVQYLSYTKS